MSNFLQKTIKFGIGFVLFIPLYVGGSFFFPFIFPKIWIFQLVVEIIFFFYVLLALTDSRFRPTRNIVFGALAALTAILIITSFTGIDAFRSFWGNTERMSGVITWFHFAAFAVILAGVLKTEKEWSKFFGIAVLSSIFQFFYVSAQYFQASWVWLPNSQVGTIGNADLLGLYTVFNAFFALYLWSPTIGESREAQRNQRFIPQGWGIFWASAFFVNLITLYFDGSRGAMLGFGAGIFIYMLASIWQNRESRKIWFGIIATGVVLYGILWALRDTDFVIKNYQFYRITHISSQDTTIQQRIVEWGIAWNAFKTRPIFGFGPNNYLYLHNAFLNPRVYNLQETNFDRAHNAYLDYASMSGIFGLLGYLFLIAAIFWVFWKAGFYTLASLMAAYAVNSFFVFDSPGSYIVLFLTIGFAAYVAGNLKSQIPNPKQIPNSKIQNPNSASPQVTAVVSLVACLLSLYVIWQVSWKPVAANMNFVTAFTGLNAGTITPEQAFEDYKSALKYETLGTTEFRNQYTQWIQNNINKFPPEKRLEVIDFGIKQLEQEAHDHPLVFGYLNLGYLNYFMANGLSDPALKQNFYQKAAESYDKAIELAPGRLEVYYAYLQLSIATKNYQKGIEVMRKATAAAPKYPQTWWYLGIAYTSAGDRENAIKATNQAIIIKYGADVVKDEGGYLIYDLDKVSVVPERIAPKMEVLGVVSNYINAQRWKELLLLYLSAAVEDPADANIHQSLALVYQNLGRGDKVQEELKIIETLKQGAK